MHLEKEVKILDVDVENVRRGLESMKCVFEGKKEQALYTYDIPTVYYRFLEIKTLIFSDNELTYLTNLKKLSNLLLEIDGMIDSDMCIEICKKYEIESIAAIASLDRRHVEAFLNDVMVLEAIKKCMINPNKWVRLRKSNDTVELTVKHILRSACSDDPFQKVIENEISVSSFEAANELLEAIGLVKRNYQEKIRYSYSYQGASIEIDIWPQIKPYVEIECEDFELTQNIIKRLGLEAHEIVSCNTEELYKRIGIDIKSIPELRF